MNYSRQSFAQAIANEEKQGRKKEEAQVCVREGGVATFL
jgi:hypothetical protein